MSSLDNSQKKTLDLGEICDNLLDILQLFPSVNLNIMKLMKVFYREHKVGSSKSLQKISEIIKKFYLLWKKIKFCKNLELEMQKNHIANIKLRKHVCRKIAFLIESTQNKSKREARIDGINLEEMIRRQHPDMGSEYLYQCKLLIKRLKNMPGEY